MCLCLWFPLHVLVLFFVVFFVNYMSCLILDTAILVSECLPLGICSARRLTLPMVVELHWFEHARRIQNSQITFVSLTHTICPCGMHKRLHVFFKLSSLVLPSFMPALPHEYVSAAHACVSNICARCFMSAVQLFFSCCALPAT